MVSLLERLDLSENIMQRIMRAIPIKILRQNLSLVYQYYKKYYNDYNLQLFLHHTEKFDEKLKEEPEKYGELIIENGFYIYILMN